MGHRTVKVTDLKVGDVLCPYGNLHFHYPIEELTVFKSGRIGVSVGKGHFEAFGPEATFEIFEEDAEEPTELAVFCPVAEVNTVATLAGDTYVCSKCEQVEGSNGSMFHGLPR